MSYRINSDYYVPRTKKDLLKAILPHWNGSKTALREMKIKRLDAIFRRIRQETITKLVRKDNEMHPSR